MGVLKLVLNILSSEVACDGDIGHRSTQQAQQSRCKNNDDQHERKECKAYRTAVVSSLTALAIAAKEVKKTRLNFSPWL
jgi:hypothetical protein